VNNTLLFVMSAHAPDFGARFPADTAPRTYGGSVVTACTVDALMVGSTSRASPCYSVRKSSS